MTLPINENFVRELTLLNVQCVNVIKRALRNPGVVATTVVDCGPNDEAEIQVIATYRKKLILPVED